MIKLQNLLETTLRTKRGSVIRRFRGNVGKAVGHRIYVHKLYADEVIPKPIWTKANEILTKAYPDFAFNTIMFDPAAKTVRFDEAPDFDTASEPHVGDFVEINLAGQPPIRNGHSDSIWHHKWMWVKDDYTGFDVDKSKKWSKLWLSKLDGPAKGQEIYWKSQLRNAGLLKESSYKNIVNMGAGYRLVGTVDAYGGVHLPDGQSGDDLHSDYNLEFGTRFSYWPGHKKVSWWIPSENDKEARHKVEDFLHRKGWPFKFHCDCMGRKIEAVDILGEGIFFDKLNASIKKLEDEWERLDSQGTGYARQQEIQRELQKLYATHQEFVAMQNLKPIIRTKQNMVTEAFTREEAALDFLKKMVQSGPFKGQVYLAGGAVRDMVLGKKPKDLDIVVINHGLRGGLDFAIWIAKQMGNYKGPEVYPPQFHFAPHIQVDDYGAPSFSPRGEPNNPDPDLMKALDEYTAYYASFSNPVLFPKFGTAKVNLTGIHEGTSLEGMEIEAVAARREEYTPGNRKPRVFPGTLKDDVFRRDFNANSLMLDLTSGQTLDLTGKGYEDIKTGTLRTTSDPLIIFKEDPLRMLRAVRFMAQKGWKIAPETEDSIRKNASWLRFISRERVRDELNKILVVADPTEAFEKMRDLGLLPYVAPELQKAVGMTQNIHHKHDVFAHTLEVLKKMKPYVINRLMALFHDIGKIATRSESPTGVHFYGHEDAGAEMVEQILANLKYPTEIIDAVKMGVKNHMRLKAGGDDAVKLSDKALRKFKIELGDNLETILDLIHADNTAHSDASNMPNQIEHVRKRLKALDIQVKSPRLPINGTELQQIFGLTPGPIIGKILSKVVDAWYDNPNITKEDAIEIAKREIR